MTKSPSSLDYSARFRHRFWVAGILLFFVFLALVKSILLPFVVGILAAYFLDPGVRKLRAWGWSRTLSAAVITAGFFIIAVTLCVTLVPLVARELTGLIQALPDYMQELQLRYSEEVEHYFTRINITPDQMGAIKDAASNLGGTLVSWIGNIAGGALQSGFALLNLLMLIIITPVVSFYLLRDWDKLVTRFDQLLPRDNADTIREQLHAIDRTLSGFIRGQTNVCLIMATYYGVALSFIGLKFGLVIGIMTGILLFVPFVGFVSCFTLSLTVALFQYSEGHLIASVLVIYGLGMLMEGSLITPRLVGSKVGLHPLWIIFGLLCGGTLFGFVGVLIAVPFTSVVGVLVRFAIARYLHSSLYSGGT